MNIPSRALLLFGALALSACNEPAQPPTASIPPATAPTAKQQLPAVDFRLAQEAIGQGLYTLTLPELTLHYLPTPVLSRADLADVPPMRTKQGQAFVSLHFNASGSEKLAQISRQHLGKWLIFTIDNQLVGLPRLTEPVTNGTLNLTMNSDQQARQVIAAIFGQ